MKAAFLSLLALTSLAVAQSPLITSTTTNTSLGGFVNANTTYIDLTVNVAGAPNGLIITQINTSSQLANAATAALDVYVKTGTHVGFHANSAAWGPVRSTGRPSTFGNPTTVVLDKAIYLAPGTYGIALHYKNMQATYTSPAPVTTVSTTEMTVDLTGTRFQNSTVAAPFSGGESGAPRMPTLSIFYQMTSYVHFSATPTLGNGTVNVQFTDGSASMDQTLGITAWNWDFENDTVFDSILQNPTKNYTCGDYSVTLAITDLFGTITETQTNLITVDPLQADFTWSYGPGPGQIQFTSTSSVSASGFSWDLDGLPGAESTLPNPTFTYPVGCAPTSVTLTATNSCRNSSVTYDVAPVPSLLTAIDSNNAGVSGAGNYFDVNVTNPLGISICGVHVNCNDDVGGVGITVDVWTRDGTYVGNDASAVGWTQTTGTATGKTFDQPTYVALPTPIFLSPGVHGMAVHLTSAGGTFGPAYMGTGASPLPGATSYTNADMTLTLGTARSVAFGGTLFSPRIWSGRLNYRTQQTGMSGYFKNGDGCAGSLGVVTQAIVSYPAVGQPFAVTFNNAPNAVVPFYGYNRTFAGLLGQPLPFDMGLVGMAPPAGCTLYIDPDTQGPILNTTAGSVTWTENVPNNPAIIGLPFHVQALSIDSVNSFLSLPGGVMSDAATGVIGV